VIRLTICLVVVVLVPQMSTRADKRKAARKKEKQTLREAVATSNVASRVKVNDEAEQKRAARRAEMEEARKWLAELKVDEVLNPDIFDTNTLGKSMVEFKEHKPFPFMVMKNFIQGSQPTPSNPSS
jgi:hypothetical protein